MRILARVAAVLALPAAALLVSPGQSQAQTIAGSLHDLDATQGGSLGEVCVYCHTPHGANVGISAPLWNRAAPAGPYTTYDSTTLDAALANDPGNINGIGSVSLACLSCHDGTQARDTVINNPGGGLGTPPGVSIGVMPAGITNLGTDLTNDHPISIQYAGIDTGAPNLIGPNKIDADFENPVKHPTLDRWWVDTGAANNTREKSDMILYTRAFSGVNQPFVECASCHDPHDPSNGTFLRIANTSSGVCLACHTK